ncbi:hypothetical protein BGX23_011701 [Mortierella sp. AD031]|nr:hypothetical protein BGX23_011701 [Mortierella sp. AD031]
MPTLTRLKLEPDLGSYWEPRRQHLRMQLLLQSFPLLEELIIMSRLKENLYGPWIRPKPPASDSASSSSADASSPSLALRELVLQKLAFAQSDLETLLACSPRLKKLRIIRAHFHGPAPKYQDIQLDLNRFHQHLQRLYHDGSLRLDSFAFTSHDIIYDNLMTAVHPNSGLRIVQEWGHRLHVCQALLQQPNNTTTLELDVQYGLHERYQQADALHNFLCSSPHLIHLKATEVRYPIEHMDIHGRLPPLPRPEGNGRRDVFARPIFLPGIWQCRKLRTLHIRINTPVPKKSMTVVAPPIAEHSRIFFGYIARVCPDLRELVLGNGDDRVNSPSFDMSILGGFCLLGRLQHLERFRTGT